MMENTNYIPVTTQDKTISSTTIQTIVGLTQHYQEKTQQYAQEIQNYNLEIEKIKMCIEEILEDKKEHEKVCTNLEQEVHYLSRIVAESNELFHRSITSYETLKSEYKKSMEASAYMKIAKQKKQSLYKLLDKISEEEQQVLSYELEYLNILEKLIPKRKEVKVLQKQLKTFELEKKHFESSQLQQVIQLPILSIAPKEIIDIDIDTVE